MERQSLKTLYVHIGTHKTGTTSVPRFLLNNTELLRQHDVYVPEAGMIQGMAGHHGLAWALRGDPRLENEMTQCRDLMAELAATDCERAIISSEDFEYLVEQPTALARFDQRIAAQGWRGCYLLCVRPQGAYVASLYGMMKEHGARQGQVRVWWRALTRGVLRMNEDWCYYLDYGRFIRQWAAVVSGPVHTIAYSEDVLPAMLRVIGVQPDHRMNEAIEKEVRHNTRRRRAMPFHGRLAVAVLNMRWRRTRPARLVGSQPGRAL